MRADKPQASTSSVRQRATLIAFVIIFVIIVWQVVGLLRGPSVSTTTRVATTTTTNGPAPALNVQPPPQQATLPPAVPVTPAQAQLLQMQQELETKYVSSVNALQMLKLQQEIEATNQAIATAQLATVTAQKGILNLLSTPAPITGTTYAPNLVSPTTVTPIQKPAAPPIVATEPSITANYTVVSVSKLLDKWRAVVGFQGSLFQVQVGDVLPPDQSRVISINNSGVVLRKGNETRRVSLVPII